jgi:ABC-type sugar transport system permease subunit
LPGANLIFGAGQLIFFPAFKRTYKECFILESHAVSNAQTAGKTGKRRINRNGTLLMLLAPAVLLLLSITIYPFVYLFYNSFFSFNLMNQALKKFVGLSNYTAMLSDPMVLNGLKNTIIFTVVAVVIQMVLGLLIALVLDSNLKGMQVLTMLFLIPMTITPIIGALTWKYLLTPPFGWINYYLMKFDIISQPIVFLGQPGTAMASLIGFNVWEWTPFVVLILLAGLKSRPMDLIEAASIDGANRFQIFRSITLPFLKRFILIAGILRVIDVFKEFTAVYGLTAGGPGQSTTLMTLVVYRKALQSYQIGYAAAIGFAFLIILTIVTLPMIRSLDREISD